jgi:hypothetical protein
MHEEWATEIQQRTLSGETRGLAPLHTTFRMAIEHFSNAVKDTKLIDVGALRGFRSLQAAYMKGHGVQIMGVAVR